VILLDAGSSIAALNLRLDQRIRSPSTSVVPTAGAKVALGADLQAAGLAAYREIAKAAKGLEIAYLQVAFRRLTLAVCSRIRRDGPVEIEIGLGDPRLPKSAFTADQMRQAEVTSRTRLGGQRHGRPAGVHWSLARGRLTRLRCSQPRRPESDSILRALVRSCVRVCRT
jgi:hypothetical protein